VSIDKLLRAQIALTLFAAAICGGRARRIAGDSKRAV